MAVRWLCDGGAVSQVTKVSCISNLKVWNYFKLAEKKLSQTSRSRKEKAGKWYLIPRLPENPGNHSPDHPCLTLSHSITLDMLNKFCFLVSSLISGHKRQKMAKN